MVAILDDGVEVGHKDLEAKIHSTWNAYTQKESLDLKAFDKHGTAAAGVVAAVAPNVKIMAIRVFDWTADGHSYYPHDVIARGIRKAADAAHVLSMGWTLGALQGVPVIEEAIDYALSKKRVLVFAAGNDGGPVDYPASLSVTKPIIAVSATDEWDGFKRLDLGEPCDWGSNFGPEINVAAPGVSLHTTDRTGRAGYCAHGNYTASYGGTSGAAAVVAGAAALILSAEPDLSPQDVRDRFRGRPKTLAIPASMRNSVMEESIFAERSAE